MLDGRRSTLIQVYSLENCRFSSGTGGGYFFAWIWIPRETAARTSISNSMISDTLIGRTSFLLGGLAPPLVYIFIIAYVTPYVNIFLQNPVIFIHLPTYQSISFSGMHSEREAFLPSMRISSCNRLIPPFSPKNLTSVSLESAV